MSSGKFTVERYVYSSLGITMSLKHIVSELYRRRVVYFQKLKDINEIRVVSFEDNSEAKQEFKDFMRSKALENLERANKDELIAAYGEKLVIKTFGEVGLGTMLKSASFTSSVNPVYQKEGFKKKDDLLELYTIQTSEDAERYDTERYNKFKQSYDYSLSSGPIFLVKYEGKDVIRLGFDLEITVGKKEVTKTFKDSENQKKVSIPYTLKETIPFLNHIQKNYKDETFHSYLKKLEDQREDVFKFSSSWGKGREGLDASPELEPAKNLTPNILKEVEQTEKKLQKLKELVNLMNQNNLENKEKIQQLTREINFDLETGTFVRTAPLKANIEEEATFIRTAPESKFLRLAPKECVDCGCTEKECTEGCLCKEGMCYCSSCT